MTATVAVLVRTKDRPLLLRRALASIAAQRIEGLQVVVVNDGGDPDEVERALDEHRDALGDLRVLHHDQPVGRARGMNVAVEACDAGCFVFHDDDDSWDPEFLARTVEALRAGDDLAIGTRVEVVWERIEGEEIVELDRELLATDIDSITLLETLYRNVAPPICLLYRREVFETLGGYDESLVAMADWDFLLRTLRRGTVGFIDEPLARWHHRRDSQGSDSNSAYAERDVHASFDRTIRDEYLRRSLVDDGALGGALMLADGVRRLDRKADAARAATADREVLGFASINEHLRVAHLAQSAQVEQLRHEIAALREQVEALHAGLALMANRSATARARSIVSRALHGKR